MSLQDADEAAEGTTPDTIHQPGLWRDNGWTAKVLKSEEGDGWAVAMIKDGEPEPALIGPWTMGRDKRNPKPLDTAAFNVLVKTASEVIRRHEQHLHAINHQNVVVEVNGERITVTLDLVADEYEPHAILAAQDAYGEPLVSVKVAANFKLKAASAVAWIESDYAKPGSSRSR